MLDLFRRRTPEEVAAQETRKQALKEARTVVKNLERELKGQGGRGVIVYESNDIWLPPAVVSRGTHVAKGKEINLRWELQDCPPSPGKPYGWESKRVIIGVLDDGATIVSFSEPDQHGLTATRWLEESLEYKGFAIVRRKAASEGRAISAEPTLEEKVRFAMREARHVSDGRFTRI